MEPHDFGRVFRHDFGRDWESWELILEETWPEITIGKTSVMILEAFFDRILEEIGRYRNSFWKRLEEIGRVGNSFWEEIWPEITIGKTPVMISKWFEQK